MRPLPAATAAAPRRRAPGRARRSSPSAPMSRYSAGGPSCGRAPGFLGPLGRARRRSSSAPRVGVAQRRAARLGAGGQGPGNPESTPEHPRPYLFRVLKLISHSGRRTVRSARPAGSEPGRAQQLHCSSGPCVRASLVCIRARPAAEPGRLHQACGPRGCQQAPGASSSLAWQCACGALPAPAPRHAARLRGMALRACMLPVCGYEQGWVADRLA